MREGTKAMRCHGDRGGPIAGLRESFEKIKWLYLHFDWGIKTRNQKPKNILNGFFDTGLHSGSIKNLEPNGLADCKVPTDLVKVNVKEVMHMGCII